MIKRIMVKNDEKVIEIFNQIKEGKTIKIYNKTRVKIE